MVSDSCSSRTAQVPAVPDNPGSPFGPGSRARLDSAQVALEAAIHLLTFSLETGGETARRNAYAALRLAESKLAAASADYEDLLMESGLAASFSR